MGGTLKGSEEEPEPGVAVLNSLCVGWESFKSVSENGWKPLQKALRANTGDAKSWEEGSCHGPCKYLFLLPVAAENLK